ncbi:TPA: AAA family ATPase [Clostridioides difficile]|uniref:ATP-dependent nuclease n=1 Tax=Clostridioides difficile TaxID=1496 RepID=UPI000B3C805E|nr:AAA family ATPase [Clostridioides difficile]MEC5403323.1 AAA family ATPase [Clostridioides difficile]TLE39802.1 ATP-binding cassette domain-containing protein [Clostridioides difficile]HBE9333761.1 AAA family ATPase [Clostridioides difficile]
MNFYVISYGCAKTKEGIYLVQDNWDDYSFQVLYDMYHVDSDLKEQRIGHIRIGKVGLEYGRVDIPYKFEKLDDTYFSLGTDVDYYDNIKKLGDDIRINILQSLSDMAYSEYSYEIGINERVTKKALLRDKSYRVIEQYRRVAKGGEVLTKYKFSYTIENSKSEEKEMRFLVQPNSLPPTNIHAIIGSNGTGKTTTLKSILNRYINDNLNIEFSNAILVSFSIFDSYHEYLKDIDSLKIKFSYIGSNKVDGTNKSHEEIKKEFNSSISNLVGHKKLGTLLEILSNLDADNNLSEYGIKEIIYNIMKKIEKSEEFIECLDDIFAVCSSGHQIILLTLVKLVELMVEKTLVIIDEPETHLHPPLLSAFIRSLSELAKKKNAVILIATHSPIVLQEIPKSCVSILRTNGDYRKVSKPSIETFGENIGILTEEIFGLEIRNTGFYKLLKEKTNYYKELGYGYDDILDEFNGELSIEAKSIIKMYLK